MPTKLIWLCAIIVTLTGCAHWLGPTEQSVIVRTLQDGHTITGLSCSLTNDKGEWQVITPKQVTVITSSEDLIATCESTGLETGTSSVVAQPWPGYLAQPVTGVLLPLGTPSIIGQKIKGVSYWYPRNIDVVLGEEFLITADQTP